MVIPMTGRREKDQKDCRGGAPAAQHAAAAPATGRAPARAPALPAATAGPSAHLAGSDGPPRTCTQKRPISALHALKHQNAPSYHSAQKCQLLRVKALISLLTVPWRAAWPALKICLTSTWEISHNIADDPTCCSACWLQFETCRAKTCEEWESTDTHSMAPPSASLERRLVSTRARRYSAAAALFREKRFSSTSCTTSPCMPALFSAVTSPVNLRQHDRSITAWAYCVSLRHLLAVHAAWKPHGEQREALRISVTSWARCLRQQASSWSPMANMARYRPQDVILCILGTAWCLQDGSKTVQWWNGSLLSIAGVHVCSQSQVHQPVASWHHGHPQELHQQLAGPRHRVDHDLAVFIDDWRYHRLPMHRILGPCALLWRAARGLPSCPSCLCVYDLWGGPVGFDCQFCRFLIYHCFWSDWRGRCAGLLSKIPRLLLSTGFLAVTGRLHLHPHSVTIALQRVRQPHSR